MGRRFALVFCCFVWFAQVLAQSSMLEKRDAFNFAKYKIDKVSRHAFFQSKSSDMGLSNETTFRLIKKIDGKGNFNHYRYKQFYKNLPVYGMSYILHEREGKVSHSNGSYLPNIHLSVQAKIQKLHAIKIAMQHMEISKYEKSTEPHLHIVDAQYPKNSLEYRLAYVFTLESRHPYLKREFIIDAQSGEVINSFDKVFDVAVEGKGLTTYYGEQSFTTDSIAPSQFKLHDSSRGDGITTFTDINGTPEELEDEDNFWDLSNIDHGSTAIDVHWGTQKFWDMLLAKLNWEGLDDAGKSMNPIVQILSGSDFANAQWDGENALFGNGDCFYNSLTSLDVIGHEFTHGIIQETANLIPRSESGAINESICDVMGKCLEYFEDTDNFTWSLGEKFLDSPFALPFRNMSNPHEFEDPNFYQGEYWRDCGTIHYNAGVGNYWFYLLANGGSGVNEIGQPYTINGIGIEEAMQIVFSTLTGYLTENSRYYEYYLASLQATEDIYGPGAVEIDLVRDAWNAVGVKEGVSIVSGIELLVDFDNPFQSTVNYFCEDGAYYQDTVLIINSGTTDYTANMFAELKLAFGVNSYYKTIDVDIPAGDTILFSINDIVPIDFNGRRNLFASIELDQNQVECLPTVVVVLQNSTITEPDVNVSSLYRSTPCEDEKGLTYSIRLNNTSCNEIPTDTKFDVRVYDSGTLIHQESKETFLDVAQGSFTSFLLELDYSLLSGSDIEVQVEMEGDTDSSNNTTILNFVKSQASIRSAYLNTFTDDIVPFNQLKYDKRTQITAPVIYQGESYFAASAFFENPDVPFCNDPIEYFVGGLSTTGKTAQLSMCVNLEGYSSSVLKFDLIQFRNDSFEYQDLITSSAFKLLINGETQFQEEFLYDLPEGEKFMYAYPLEDNFNGNISLQFFNRAGTLPSNPDFFDFDVILLDNLEIDAGTTATNQLTKSTSTNIFPNPSKEFLQIDSEKEIAHATIFNKEGKTIHSLINPMFNQNIDLSKLLNGYYLLKIQYKDESSEVIPFIKVD